MPESEPKPAPLRRPGPFQDAASTFNILSNPLRLRVLALLAEGGKALGQLCEATGRESKLIGSHLQILSQAGLAASQRDGKNKTFTLTASGVAMFRSIGPVLQAAIPACSEVPSSIPERPSPRGGPEDLPRVLKALADPTRLRILNVLAHADEVCVCHLHEALKLPQSTISRHLALLKDAGIIAGTRRGTWVYYRLVHGGGGFRESLISAINPSMTTGGQYRLDLDRLRDAPSCD